MASKAGTSIVVCPDPSPTVATLQRALPPGSTALFMYLARVYGKHAAARLGTWSWQATDVVHFDFLPPELRKCSWPTAARYEWRRNDSSSPSRFFALGAAAGPPRAFSHTRLLWQLRRADMCAGVHGTSAHPRNPSGCSTLPNAWVEVTHVVLNGRKSEKKALWLLRARGSGLWLHTGSDGLAVFDRRDVLRCTSASETKFTDTMDAIAAGKTVMLTRHVGANIDYPRHTNVCTLDAPYPFFVTEIAIPRTDAITAALQGQMNRECSLSAPPRGDLSTMPLRWGWHPHVGGPSARCYREQMDEGRLVRCILWGELYGTNTRETLSEPSARPSPTASREAAATACIDRSVAWFHPPKTGTSFGTLLAHFANPRLPAAAQVQDCSVSRCHHAAGNFSDVYPMATWFKHGLLWEPEKKRFGDHAGIGEDDYKMWEGRFFAMFRHPARRAVSEYAHKLRDKSRMTARAFAQQHEGMVTLLLTGQIYDDVAGRGPTARMSELARRGELPKPNLALAMRRLRDGFAFVGLTDEFDLSVCLFHRMFGGPCSSFELYNMRPTNYTERGVATRPTSDQSALKVLGGYVDPFDTPLYELARARFKEECAAYNVTAESCIRTCFGT